MRARDILVNAAWGGLALLALVWVWEGTTAHPALNDERAYATQAALFASGRWVAPAAPIPEFFEQVYVFPSPFIASKYWPGHSLALTPGFALGFPTLIPALWAGLTAALCFAVIRAAHGPSVASIATLLWIGSIPALLVRASFLSHTTTTMAWIAGLWFLTRAPRKWPGCVFIGGLCLGVVGLARPLTGFALGSAWLVGLIATASTQRMWRALAAATVAVVVTAGGIVVWTTQTTGKLCLTPYTYYAQLYFPFDRIGFSFDDSTPMRTLPPDLQYYGRELASVFRVHLPERIPSIAWERVTALGRQLCDGYHPLLWMAACVGIVLGWRESLALRLATLSAATLFVAYLLFAHPPEWTAYYSETFPVFYWATALGLVRGAQYAAWAGRFEFKERTIATGLLLLAVPFVFRNVDFVRLARLSWESQGRLLRTTIGKHVEPPAIVFVQHAEGFNPAFGLVSADPFWPDAPVWIVYDFGTFNESLAAYAPARRTYRYLAPHGTLEVWEPRSGDRLD